MRTLALDPVTGDLAFDATGRLYLLDGADAIAQRATLRCALWQGEYLLDTTVGIPYPRLLGRKDGGAALETTLRQAIATTPGLASLDRFSFALDAKRRATVGFSGRAGTGEPVSVAAFVAAP